MAAAVAPVGDGVVPFEGTHTRCYLPLCAGALVLSCGTMCSNNESKTFLPGSDDSDSDENQGRTMATEFELAPLEGAVILPVSFESGRSPGFALLPPNARMSPP